MKHILSPMSSWHHDLCSCLQCCMASVLLYHNQDPTLSLGAAWDFYFTPQQFRKEEYYYPCRWPGLANSLLPFHGVSSCWHQVDNPDAGWLAVQQVIQKGSPVIVAVDNFYLPFRPAYQDIHAGHLIVVYGFDEEAELAYVLDATPPAFMGPIPLAALKAARNSSNPADERDYFFSNAPVANRWLEINFHEPFPLLTREGVTHVIEANVRRFRQPGNTTALSGMSGLAQYFAILNERMTGSDGSGALEELYVVGWAIQASTALHADFLSQAGRQLDWYELTEIGRQVEHIAHHWTALRMLGAHGRAHPHAIRERIQLRTTQLLIEQNIALDQLQRVLEQLQTGKSAQ